MASICLLSSDHGADGSVCVCMFRAKIIFSRLLFTFSSFHFKKIFWFLSSLRSASSPLVVFAGKPRKFLLESLEFR